jgi:hypothetical protein
MQLIVTIKRGEDIERIRPLIERVREALSEQNVTVLEAPTDLNYGYPFPVVTVSEGPDQVRHFGTEAVALLQSMSGR